METIRKFVSRLVFCLAFLALLIPVLANAGVCADFSRKVCVGNTIYWYDACGNPTHEYQTCPNYYTCQNGQCVYQQQHIYIFHYSAKCYGNNLYWHDSYGSPNDLYKTCADSNLCTADSCVSGSCQNALACDGSSCPVGSEDYQKYCFTNHCGNGLCEDVFSENSSNCSSDCKIQEEINLSAVLFVKKDASSNQWQKSAQVNSNDTVYFMVSVNNNSAFQVDSANVSVSIPQEISSLGDLKINDVPSSGDIVSGISIGSLAAGSAKSVTFTGKSSTIYGAAQKQAEATASAGSFSQSDKVDLSLNPAQAAGAMVAPSTSGILNFLKRWYLWILAALVLIFLFIIVFKRLSSNNA